MSDPKITIDGKWTGIPTIFGQANANVAWNEHIKSIIYIAEHLKIVPIPGHYIIRIIAEDQYMNEDGTPLGDWNGYYLIQEINNGGFFIKFANAKCFESVEAMRSAVAKFVEENL